MAYMEYAQCERCKMVVPPGDHDAHRVLVEQANRTMVYHYSCFCEQAASDLAGQRDSAQFSFHELFREARACLASFGGDPKGVSQFDVINKIQERRRALESADAQKLVTERDRVTELLSERTNLVQSLDDAYDERNRVIIALAKLAHRLGWKAGFKHDEKGEDGFKWCVFVELHADAYKEPVQVSWHVTDEIARTFRRDLIGARTLLHKARCLPQYDGTYDGHTTAQKYQRLDDMLLGATPEKHVQNLKRERDDALEETRPVAEWCLSVLAVIRATENDAIAKIRRWRALGTKADGALAELEAFCQGVTAAYDAVREIPGWTGYERAADGEPTSILHHAVSVHEKAAARANARLEFMVEMVEHYEKAYGRQLRADWRDNVEDIA